MFPEGKACLVLLILLWLSSLSYHWLLSKTFEGFVASKENEDVMLNMLLLSEVCEISFDSLHFRISRPLGGHVRKQQSQVCPLNLVSSCLTGPTWFFSSAVYGLGNSCRVFFLWY